jgi:hypothetical protein
MRDDQTRLFWGELCHTRTDAEQTQRPEHGSAKQPSVTASLFGPHVLQCRTRPSSIWHSQRPVRHRFCPMSKKTSFPRQDIRVLLLEGVSQSAVETFRCGRLHQYRVAHAKSLPKRTN